MDRYSAVTEYRFEARAERVPSLDENVFCLVTCGNPVTFDDEDDVDVRDGASIVSAILSSVKL